MSFLFGRGQSTLEVKASRSGNLPTIPERIDQFGLGMSQLYTCILGGGLAFAVGAELLLVSAVTHEVTADLNLVPHQRGMVVSVLFLGILIGNLLAGPLGDLVGRRQPVILSYACIFIFSVLSSYALGFFSLCIARILLGMAFGIGQPACNSLLAEISPSYWRIVVVTSTSAIFVVGEVYSCWLMIRDDPNMRELDWRSLIRWSAAPTFVMGCVTALFLIESPSFLATQGRNQEARDVLTLIRDTNGSPDEVDFAAPSGAAADDRSLTTRFELIFCPQLKVTTWILMYSCFMLNFIYYGSLYAFPQVLPDLETQGSPAMQILIGALWELPGNFLGMWVGLRMERKPSMKCYLFAVAMSFVLFMLGAGTHSGDTSAFQRFAIMAGYYGVKAFSCAGFAVVYMYVTEVFPTPARVTGSAVCLAAGRVAGMATPLAFEMLLAQTGGSSAFFALTVTLVLANYFLIDMLPYETFGTRLKDSLKDFDGAAPCDESSYGTAGRP